MGRHTWSSRQKRCMSIIITTGTYFTIAQVNWHCQIRFIADPALAFTKALDLSFDGAAIFGGDRSKRYALVIENGKVKKAHIEPDNIGVNGSSSPCTFWEREVADRDPESTAEKVLWGSERWPSPFCTKMFGSIVLFENFNLFVCIINNIILHHCMKRNLETY